MTVNQETKRARGFFAHKTLAALYRRFSEGKFYSKKEVMKRYKYFKDIPKDTALKILGSWFYLLRKRFLEEQKPFGNVSGSHHERGLPWKHGLATSPAQINRIVTSRFLSSRGNSVRSEMVIEAASKQHILPRNLIQPRLPFYRGKNGILGVESKTTHGK